MVRSTTMYGMVNKFISTTVKKRYGEDQWQQISALLDNSHDSYIEMQPYSDDVTFGIVGACVNHLNVELSDFLRQMGEDWVYETSSGNYQSMYSLVTGGAFEFLSNLNNMHQVISAQMHDLLPPSFLCKKLEDNSVEVHYFSQRDGLDSFVEGLLVGVCHHFNEPATVSLVSTKSEEQPFSVFNIRFE